jgi:D-tyrosyl-tRNA(Tyr) deacylase
MRVTLQRVTEASVVINDILRADIQHGLVVFLGITNEDSTEDIEWLCRKICALRIFNDASGKMNNSLMDVKGEVLVISQFTLYASTKNGNRPSYIKAAKPDIAIPLYNSFIDSIGVFVSGAVKTGEFGADMKISLINDGPVTIHLDSKVKE